MDNGAKVRYSVLIVMVGLLALMGVKFMNQSKKLAETHVSSIENTVSFATVASAPSDTIGESERAYSPFVNSANTNFEFWYHGQVVKVVDGDTFDMQIDLGMDVSILKRIRMAGINAPEMGEAPRGENAKQFLNKMVGGKNVIIKTAADNTDRYGRILATVFTVDGATNMNNVNDVMVKSNQAVIY